MNKIIFLVLSLAVLSCTHQSTQTNAIDSSEIEHIINQSAQALLADKRFHSLSIGVYKDGSSITRHFGELEIGKGNTPNDSTIYEVASVSKTFLGTLAARAVLEQKIDLHDDIRKYLPQTYPNLAFGAHPITIQHLLTHTSGFPNFPVNGDSKAGFWEGLNKIKIQHKPGTQYAYSNTAPEVLAFILEKAYQKPYEQLIQKYILTPLQMNTTYFELPYQMQKRLVQGYNDTPEKMPNFKRTLWGGSIGLHTTVADFPHVVCCFSLINSLA